MDRRKLAVGVLFILAAAWVVARPSVSSAEDDSRNASIDKALKAAGITSQLEMLAETTVLLLPADAFRDAKARKDVLDYVKTTATQESCVASVRAVFHEVYDQEKIEKVIDFFQSKLGRKVGRIQSGALAPPLLNSLREGRKEAASQDESRADLIRRIIEGRKVSDANARLRESAVRGLLEGATGHEDRHGTKARSRMKSLEGSLQLPEDRAGDAAMVAFSITFRSLDDKELVELATFQESEHGSWFRSAVLDGLNEAVYKVAKALGEAVKPTTENAPQKAGPEKQ